MPLGHISFRRHEGSSLPPRRERLLPAATPVVDPAPGSAGRSGEPPPTRIWGTGRISGGPHQRSPGRHPWGARSFSPPRIAVAHKSSQLDGALYGTPRPSISTVVRYLSFLNLISIEPSSLLTSRAPFNASASRKATCCPYPARWTLADIP